jgi:hypothetical protein
MDQLLNSIWSENLYPAKVKLLKLAREQKPETQLQDVEQFLNGQISYQLLKEAKTVKSHIGHIVVFHLNEIWQIDIYMM